MQATSYYYYYKLPKEQAQRVHYGPMTKRFPRPLGMNYMDNGSSTIVLGFHRLFMIRSSCSNCVQKIAPFSLLLLLPFFLSSPQRTSSNLNGSMLAI